MKVEGYTQERGPGSPGWRADPRRDPEECLRGASDELLLLERAQRRDNSLRSVAQRLGDVRTLGIGDGLDYVLHFYDGYEESEGDALQGEAAAFVAALPDAEREVFQMIFGENESTRDAGKRLGVSHMKVHRMAAAIVAKARRALHRDATEGNPLG